MNDPVDNEVAMRSFEVPSSNLRCTRFYPRGVRGPNSCPKASRFCGKAAH